MSFFNMFKGKNASSNEKLKDEMKDDLSTLNDLQVLEKIDTYANEMKASINNRVLVKLENAVNEFDKRYNSYPFYKRSAIKLVWENGKANLATIKMHMQKPAVNSTAMISVSLMGLTASIAHICTELSK